MNNFFQSPSLNFWCAIVLSNVHIHVYVEVIYMDILVHLHIEYIHVYTTEPTFVMKACDIFVGAAAFAGLQIECRAIREWIHARAALHTASAQPLPLPNRACLECLLLL